MSLIIQGEPEPKQYWRLSLGETHNYCFVCESNGLDPWIPIKDHSANHAEFDEHLLSAHGINPWKAR